MPIETKTTDIWICDLCNNNRQTVPATETPTGWIEFVPAAQQLAKPRQVCPRCVAEIQRAAADVMPEVVS